MKNTLAVGHYKLDRRHKDIAFVKACDFLNKPTKVKKIKSGLNHVRAMTCIIIIAASWYMCWSNNQPKPQTAQAQTEEVPNVSPLTQEQGFEQVAMREEPVAREGVEQTIRRYFGKDADKAIKISTCESGMNPERINNNPKTRDYSVGLFQVNLYGKLAKNRPSEEWLKIPENNVSYAKMLFDAAKGRFGQDWVNCSRKNGIK